MQYVIKDYEKVKVIDNVIFADGGFTDIVLSCFRLAYFSSSALFVALGLWDFLEPYPFKRFLFVIAFYLSFACLDMIFTLTHWILLAFAFSCTRKFAINIGGRFKKRVFPFWSISSIWPPLSIEYEPDNEEIIIRTGA